MKIKNAVKITMFIFIALFLIVGIPIIINECYMKNKGYITVWGGADVLSYYGTVLGSMVAITTLVITILFTKKQLQRDNYLETERKKWTELKEIFLDIAYNINPMLNFKEVMDCGISDPAQAISILQKYQLNCKMSNDRLIAAISKSDESKFEELVANIVELAEDLVNISQQKIELYSDLRIWKNKESALEMIEIEEKYPGTFLKEHLEINKENIEKIKTINCESINLQLAELQKQSVDMYAIKYRNLLKLIGTTFDNINIETQQKADKILLFKLKCGDYKIN